MTTTHDTPQAHQNPPAGSQRPEPLDPENDTDAKSTTIWVLASTVVLFVSLYFMLPLFDEVLQTERYKKIDERPALELDEVLEEENSFLDGDLNSAHTNIQQVMERMSK